MALSLMHASRPAEGAGGADVPDFLHFAASGIPVVALRGDPCRLLVSKIRAGLFIFNFTPGIFSASTRAREQTPESNWSCATAMHCNGQRDLGKAAISFHVEGLDVLYSTMSDCTSLSSGAEGPR